MKNQKYSKIGFTLIELMVVVVLIGALASIAIPNYIRAVEGSHVDDAIAQLTSAHGANLIYRANDGTQFLPDGGGTLTIGAINAGLGINLIANGMVYSYDQISANEFDAWATRTWAAGTYTVLVDENPISATNPACSGACP